MRPRALNRAFPFRQYKCSSSYFARKTTILCTAKKRFKWNTHGCEREHSNCENEQNVLKKILCSIMAHVGAIFFRFAWVWCECMWGIAEASLGILSRKRTFSYFRHFLFLLLWRARIAIWYFATAAAVDPLCSPYFVFTFCWVWAFNLQTKGSNVAFFPLLFQKE